IGAAPRGLADGCRGGIHGRGDPSDRVRAGHLEAVQGRAVVRVRGDTEVPIEIFEDGFQFHFDSEPSPSSAGLLVPAGPGGDPSRRASASSGATRLSWPTVEKVWKNSVDPSTSWTTECGMVPQVMSM